MGLDTPPTSLNNPLSFIGSLLAIIFLVGLLALEGQKVFSTTHKSLEDRLHMLDELLSPLLEDDVEAKRKGKRVALEGEDEVRGSDDVTEEDESEENKDDDTDTDG
ncbi:hypothetical protein M434DRAFT_26969 [Hypoxylon sp. CO27-5]|nr:hypothetical protein M434DRAFT_26969 [Hypoxylon sp. CO27-5]